MEKNRAKSWGLNRKAAGATAFVDFPRRNRNLATPPFCPKWDSKPCVKERLSKSLTINPVEGQMDSKSTESSCLQDTDSAVETSISISLRKRGKDASKEALTYTTAILIDQCGLK